MRCLGLLACALLLATTLLGQDSPPDTQIGNFLCKVPAGWSRQVKGDTTFLFAPSGAGSITFIALGADDLQTDLQTSFNIEWEGFQKQYRILEGGQVASGRLPNGYGTFYTSATALDAKGTRWAVSVVAAQLGSRIQTVMFMSSALNPLLAEHERTFVAFLSTLRFTGHAAPHSPAAAAPAASAAGPGPSAGPPPPGKGRFDGLYRAVGVTSDPLSPQARIGYKFVVFFPDGRFREGIPDEGLGRLDMRAEMRWHPVFWGTYQMAGDVGRVLFPPSGGSTEPIIWPIKQYSDRVRVHGDDYVLLDRCDGLRLEGVFRRSDYQTTYAARQGIAFTRDGRFADEGAFKAAGVMVLNATGGYDFDEGGPGQGTYRIFDYTLELTYADGRVKRTSFYLEPGTPKDKVREFYLNTWKFARVQ